jgi:predicted AlkP superfamily phosphohydrolase/phosphomutase
MNLTETQCPLDADVLNQFTDTVNESTRNIRELALNLLDSQPWDFALVSFTATHISGHQLWRDTSLHPDIGEARSELRTEALESVYINCDHAIGSLVGAVPNHTMVMLASLHGMEANTSRCELLPEMLKLVLSGHAGHRSDEGSLFQLLRAMRDLLPRDWRHKVKKRLPRSLQHWLTALWRTGGKDWSRTKAFALIPDLQGYIRINMQGRETEGLVKSGEEYDALCDQIIAGLAQFVDADTGMPVIAEAKRMNEICPGVADLSHLPDIAIKWSDIPCSAHREVTSPYGSVPWPTPGLDFDGRSGNHRPYGFFWASGDCIRQGTNVADVNIEDLAPTLYDLFGLSKPAHMHGQSFLNRISRDNHDDS